MKSLSILLSVLLLSHAIYTADRADMKTQLRKKSHLISLEQDVEGESSNEPGKDCTGAVAFGLGSNGGYTLQDESHYFKPQILDALPEKLEPSEPSPVEVAAEIPSITDYYDGENKLNKVVINCHIYANPTDCLHQGRCGWCGATKTCIVGNTLGPMENCIRSTFIFSAPHLNASLSTRLNDNVAQVHLSVIPK